MTYERKKKKNDENQSDGYSKSVYTFLGRFWSIAALLIIHFYPAFHRTFFGFNEIESVDDLFGDAIHNLFSPLDLIIPIGVVLAIGWFLMQKSRDWAWLVIWAFIIFWFGFIFWGVYVTNTRSVKPIDSIAFDGARYMVATYHDLDRENSRWFINLALYKCPDGDYACTGNTIVEDGDLHIFRNSLFVIDQQCDQLRVQSDREVLHVIDGGMLSTEARSELDCVTQE